MNLLLVSLWNDGKTYLHCRCAVLVVKQASNLTTDRLTFILSLVDVGKPATCNEFLISLYTFEFIASWDCLSRRYEVTKQRQDRCAFFCSKDAALLTKDLQCISKLR